MYSIDWSMVLRTGRPGRDVRTAGARAAVSSTSISPVVWALGFTSMLTDISSEMVSSVLPAYLVLHLRMSPLAFGTIDGIYQGGAALLRLAAGFAGDRLQQHKAIATAGYALSAACRLALLAAGNAWMAIAAVVALDRAGKGIRTAPRDAMISLSSEPSMLGRAFGVHRSLDAAGAMLGPLCAFLLLAWLPSGFDAVFVLSFCVAIVGVSVIALFVNPARDDSAEAAPPLSFGEAAGLLRHGSFARLLVAAGVLSAATISDAFVFLILQEHAAFGAGIIPLLFVVVACTNFVLAAPLGRLADRRGRLQVFVGGHVLLLLVYVLLLLPQESVAYVATCLVALGAYYAATDGVVAALAAAQLPKSLCGSGLALVATATNIGRLLASVLFGLLWSWIGLAAAMTWFAAALGLALLLAAGMLRQTGNVRQSLA